MSVETESWSRCGNTDYYRRQWGMLPLPESWFYVDPFNWQYINCWPQDPRGPRSGLTAVIWQKARNYDWDTLKHGVQFVADTREEQLPVLRATHEWANDLIKARDRSASKDEIRKLFRAAPAESQALVLDGVRALLVGYEHLALQENKPTPARSSATLVVTVGSPADANVDQILEEFHDLHRVIRTKRPEEGFEEALADYGILEC